MTTSTADIATLHADLRSLRDRQEAVDALYRFAAGQDLKDEDLFLSAFTADPELDFTQPAARFGADVPVMGVGRRSPVSWPPSHRWTRPTRSRTRGSRSAD